MKNKTYHAFGFYTGRFDNHKIVTSFDEDFMKLLRKSKRLTNGQVDDTLDKLKTSPLYQVFEGVRLADIHDTRKGVTKCIAEESVMFISKDLTKAKLAFANYYVNNECF